MKKIKRLQMVLIMLGGMSMIFTSCSEDDFAGFVVSQQPSPKEKGENVVFEILTCEIEGTTALVKIRDKYLGITFLDTLSFIKVEDEWKIYNKLFNAESE